MDFTKQDLNVLFEAVESWEREDNGPGFTGHMMAALVGDRSPEIASQIEDRLKEKQKKADEDRRLRKERGVMLRAKLITLRDKMDANSFCESITGN